MNIPQDPENIPPVTEKAETIAVVPCSDGGILNLLAFHKQDNRRLRDMGYVAYLRRLNAYCYQRLGVPLLNIVDQDYDLYQEYRNRRALEDILSLLASQHGYSHFFRKGGVVGWH